MLIKLIEKNKLLIVMLITVFFCLYTPFLLIKDIGIVKAGISLSAADSFYYLNVADNFTKHSIMTYDGVHPTNGFHPLWQWILALSFQNIHTSEGQLIYTFLLSIALITLSVVMITIFLFRITNNPVVTLLSVIPGFSYFILSFIHFKYFSIWAFMNGMETVLSLFFFGLLLILILKFDLFISLNKKKLLLSSFLLTLLTLSRLDDIFIFIPFLFNIIIQTKSFKEIFKHLFFASIVPVLIIGSYLMYNFYYSGMWLPVSGMVKGGIAFINFAHLINVFIPVWIAFPDRIHNWINWVGTSLRAMQVMLPMIVSGLLIGKYWRGFKVVKIRVILVENRIVYLFIMFSIYILIKTLYNFVFVNFWNQGHWYFPIAIIMTNIIVGYLASKYIKSSKYLFSIVIVFLLLFSNHYANHLGSGFDTKVLNLKEQNGINMTLFENRKRLIDTLNHIPYGTGMIEFDDGIISYGLKIPSISGFAFCMDKKAFGSLNNGDLLDLAYKRGIRSMSSVFYFPDEDTLYQTSESIRKFLKRRVLKDEKNLIKWKFQLIYNDSVTKLKIISFESRFSQ